jgi:hypothetical protein
VNDFFANVAANTIANICTAIAFAVVAYMIYLRSLFTERKKTLKFFGITPKSKQLTIIVSRLKIKPGGTEPIDGQTISKGYTEIAIAKPEYDGALLLSKLIEPRWIAIIPKTLRDWLSNRYVSFARIEASIDVSPKSEGEVPKTNIISIGSSIYNAATSEYLKHPSCKFQFEKIGEERVIVSHKLGSKGIVPGRDAMDRELAVIQRVHDKQFGNTVIICAGLGWEATYASIEYLLKNRQKIELKCKDNDFGILLAGEWKKSGGISLLEMREIDSVLIEKQEESLAYAATA